MQLRYPDYESIIGLYTQGIYLMYDNKRQGGKDRSSKGALTENLLEAIVSLAWHEVGGEAHRFNIAKRRLNVPIDTDYVRNLTPESTRNYVEQNMEGYFYKVELDKGVEIDNQLVLAVECKAYTENAMLKRVLKDFELASIANPKLLFCLFQLENALGGDYGDPNKSEYLGSESTHTLMSHSPTVSLEIITLLDSNHHPTGLLHKPEHFKELPVENVTTCVSKFRTLLEFFV
jgi:hypothetical protein